MSERFYKQQGQTITSIRTKTGVNKPKRKLKKDVVSDIENLLGKTIPGLDMHSEKWDEMYKQYSKNL